MANKYVIQYSGAVELSTYLKLGSLPVYTQTRVMLGEATLFDTMTQASEAAQAYPTCGEEGHGPAIVREVEVKVVLVRRPYEAPVEETRQVPRDCCIQDLALGVGGNSPMRTVFAKDVKPGMMLFNKDATSPAFQWIRVTEVILQEKLVRIVTTSWITGKHPDEGVIVKEAVVQTEHE
jgi:hypothetical protein